MSRIEWKRGREQEEKLRHGKDKEEKGDRVSRKKCSKRCLNPLKNKDFEKRCKKSKKTSKKVLTEKWVRGIMYKLA